jgi:hypothetical protein
MTLSDQVKPRHFVFGCASCLSKPCLDAELLATTRAFLAGHNAQCRSLQALRVPGTFLTDRNHNIEVKWARRWPGLSFCLTQGWGGGEGRGVHWLSPASPAAVFLLCCLPCFIRCLPEAAQCIQCAPVCRGRWWLHCVPLLCVHSVCGQAVWHAASAVVRAWQPAMCHVCMSPDDLAHLSVCKKSMLGP